MKRRATRSPIDRLLAKVVETESGCWQWTGATSRGYAHIRAGRRGEPYLIAHRVVYEHFIGPIPHGLTIDHLCRNRSCLNPAHLEAVTDRVNTLRGETIPAANAAKTHCIRGHPFAGANLVIRADGGRRCRACDREKHRRYRARKKPVRGVR